MLITNVEQKHWFRLRHFVGVSGESLGGNGNIDQRLELGFPSENENENMVMYYMRLTVDSCIPNIFIDYSFYVRRYFKSLG